MRILFLLFPLFLFGATAYGLPDDQACMQRIYDYGRRFPELRNLVTRMEANWPANHQAIRYLRDRLLGSQDTVEPELAFYRLVAESGDSFEFAELDYFRFVQSVGVQALLDQMDMGPYSTQELRGQLRAKKTSRGIILGLLPVCDWQINAVEWLERNRELDSLPRSVLAEGMTPVCEPLRRKITQIHYNAVGTSWGGMQLLPTGQSYPMHLFGGFLDIALVSGLDRLLLEVLASPVKHVQLIIHYSFSGISELDNPDGSRSRPILELDEEEREFFFSRFASEVLIRISAQNLRKKSKSQYFTLDLPNGKRVSIDFQP